MQIQPIAHRSVMTGSKARQAAPAQIQFGYEPKDPKKPGWGDQLNEWKRKMTPSFDTQQDLKQVGMGVGIIMAGQFAAPLIPVAGAAIATVATFGGMILGGYALMRIVTRK